MSLMQINNSRPASTTTRTHAMLTPRTPHLRKHPTLDILALPLGQPTPIRTPMLSTHTLRHPITRRDPSRQSHGFVELAGEIVPELALAADDEHFRQRFGGEGCVAVGLAGLAVDGEGCRGWIEHAGSFAR